jgi:hypothetical protein
VPSIAGLFAKNKTRLQFTDSAEPNYGAYLIYFIEAQYAISMS